MDRFNGLDFLMTAVIIVDHDLRIVYVNVEAENMLAYSSKLLIGKSLQTVVLNCSDLSNMCRQVLSQPTVEMRQEIVLEQISRMPLHLFCSVKQVEIPQSYLCIELRENVHQSRQEREDRLMDQNNANKELVRNLAHEIKNPLGGIRGAAQLLELELPESALREYTQVIIRESERLQTLVDRLLVPHRRPHITEDINIHEVCERVRSLILAEYSSGLEICRDYDLSLPELTGDKEQLIQAVLNIAQNACHAMKAEIKQSKAQLIFKTRVARRITLAKVNYKLALNLHIIDNGPGIAKELQERIFFPLVSGREGGSGLGLTLSQTVVRQHGGIIECDSQPGCTQFLIRLPLVKA